MYRKSGGGHLSFLLPHASGGHQLKELLELKFYRKSCSGWKEADFVTKTVAARNARPNSPTHLNSTLNRPMASQGGTRWVLAMSETNFCGS